MNIRNLLLSALIFATAIPATAQSGDQDQAGNAPAAQEPPHPDQAPDQPKQENPAEPEAHGTRLRWRDIPRNVLNDEKAIFTSPFHINRENAKWWVLFGAGTAALIASDQKISDSLPQTNKLTTPSRWTSRLGAPYSLYPLWSMFYLVGKAGDNPRARDTGRLGIEALIDTEITVNILKTVTQRPRPVIKGESVRFFKGGNSFPSGHSIQSWALARVLSREFPERKIYSILAYSAAATVSVSRVAGRRHSASDALAGAAMGFFIGDYVYRHHHAPSEKSKVISWLGSHVDFNVQLGTDRSLERSRLIGLGNPYVK
jgi:membrane-associated phospholipid phosphatase